MLDFDLADLHGVETRTLVQGVGEGMAHHLDTVLGQQTLQQQQALGRVLSAQSGSPQSFLCRSTRLLRQRCRLAVPISRRH